MRVRGAGEAGRNRTRRREHHAMSAATTSETMTFRNHIGGEWVPAAAGRTVENYDPATGELIGHFPRSGQADVEAAVAAAKAAYDGWRRTPAPKRGEIL